MKEHIIEVRYDINGELESDKNAGRVIQRNNLTNKVDIYFKTPFKTIAEANASIGTMYGRLYLKLPNETTITLPRFTSENTSPKKMYDRTYFENGYLRLSFDLDKRMCIEAGRVECTLELSQDTGKTEEVDEEEIAVFQIDNYRTFYLQIEQSANTENPTITDDDLDWWDLVYSKISGAVAQLKNTGTSNEYLSGDGTYHKIPTFVIMERRWNSPNSKYYEKLSELIDECDVEVNVFFVDNDGNTYICLDKQVMTEEIFMKFAYFSYYTNENYITCNIVDVELYEGEEDNSLEKKSVQVATKGRVDLLQQLYNGIPDWAKQREKPTYDSDEIYYDSTHSVYEKVDEIDTTSTEAKTKVETLQTNYLSHLTNYAEVNAKANANQSEIAGIKTNYTTKTYVDNQIAIIREIAEGKTKSIVVNGASDINVVSGSVGANEFSVSINDLTDLTKLGDVLLIKALELPDYYLGKIDTNYKYFYKLETTKVDLTPYAKKTEVNAIDSRLQTIEAISPTLTSVAENEASRVSAESLRASAEVVRQQHETTREEYFENFKNTYDSKIGSFEGAETLTEAQYEALATKQDKYYFVVEE